MPASARPLPVDSPAPPALSASSLATWLLGAGEAAPGGLWPAWTNPARPGFAYEEATAWVVRCVRQRSALFGCSVSEGAPGRGVAALRASVASHGALRAGGRAYLFDTAVGLAALDDMPSRKALLATVTRFVRERRAVEGGPRLGDERPETHWSDAFGAHLLWVNVPLRELGERALADDLTALLLPRVTRDDGLLRVHGASDRVYTHAMAYGLDGLSVAGNDGVARTRAGLSALLRTESGGKLLPAWTGEPSPGRADATAQCAGLARRLLHDGPQAAARLLTALATLQADDGGLRYETGSEDRNTCAAVFALEVLDGPDA